MNKKEIDALFEPKLVKGEKGTDEYKAWEDQYFLDEVVKAHMDICDLQKGDKQTLKTGIEHTDYKLIDGLSNKMVFYGSRPSMGKTYLCDKIITNLGDKKLNPMPVETLRLNWEMATKMLLLRKLKIELGKSMREIITTPYTEQEKKIVKNIVSSLRRDGLSNCSKIIEGEEFRYLINKFCASGDPDAEKVVLVDHIHILSDKKRIDAFISICNELKLEHTNLSFVFFFQLNRLLEEYWRGSKDNKPNPKNFRPSSQHIYNTDSLMQYADLVCTLIIPQVVNLDEYAAVYRDSYDHLSAHFVEDNLDADWVRLEGRNRIYYEYIKDRLIDDFEEPKLFCEILSMDRENNIKDTYTATKPKTKEPNFKTVKLPLSASEIKNLDTTPVPIVFSKVENNFDLKNAFEVDDDYEDPDLVPF